MKNYFKRSFCTQTSFSNAELNFLFNNVSLMKKILNFDDLGQVFQFHQILVSEKFEIEKSIEFEKN